MYVGGAINVPVRMLVVADRCCTLEMVPTDTQEIRQVSRPTVH